MREIIPICLDLICRSSIYDMSLIHGDSIIFLPLTAGSIVICFPPVKKDETFAIRAPLVEKKTPVSQPIPFLFRFESKPGYQLCRSVAVRRRSLNGVVSFCRCSRPFSRPRKQQKPRRISKKARQIWVNRPLAKKAELDQERIKDQ